MVAALPWFATAAEVDSSNALARASCSGVGFAESFVVFDVPLLLIGLHFLLVSFQLVHLHLIYRFL